MDTQRINAINLAKEAAEVYLAQGKAEEGWLEFVRVMRDMGETSLWLSYGTIHVLHSPDIPVGEVRTIISEFK